MLMLQVERTEVDLPPLGPESFWKWRSKGDRNEKGGGGLTNKKGDERTEQDLTEGFYVFYISYIFHISYIFYDLF